MVLSTVQLAADCGSQTEVWPQVKDKTLWASIYTVGAYVLSYLYKFNLGSEWWTIP